MYNKEDVFNVLKAIDHIIPSSSYVVVYGAAMVVHGIKEECADIDITVESPEVFNGLIDNAGYCYVGYRNHRKISIIDSVDLFDGGLSVKDYTVDNIEGHRIMSIRSLREEKQLRGRPKDLTDVTIIDRWIDKQWLKDHR